MSCCFFDGAGSDLMDSQAEVDILVEEAVMTEEVVILPKLGASLEFT